VIEIDDHEGLRLRFAGATRLQHLAAGEDGCD
jgi:hypothetical protein